MKQPAASPSSSPARRSTARVSTCCSRPSTRVAAEVPDVRLRVVGAARRRGPPAGALSVRTRRARGTRPTRPSLAAELRRADCLVLPSRNDSYGMVVPEALASGLPVLVSDMVGAKDLVAEGQNGWVVPAGDAGALAERMLVVRPPPARCGRMRAGVPALGRGRHLGRLPPAADRPPARARCRSERRLKILHVVPTYVPAWRHGGPIRAVHGLCRALAARGPRGDGLHHRRGRRRDGSRAARPTGAGRRRRGLVLPGAPPGGSTARRRWAAALRRGGGRLRRRPSPFGLPLAHRRPPPAPPSGRASRTCSPRAACWSADLIRAARPAGASACGSASSSAGRWRGRPGSTSTSDLEAEEAARLGLPLPPAFVVPNGVDPEPLAAGDEARSRAAVRAVLAGRPFLLFLGRLSWKKGLDRLIPALAHVPGAVLAVAGNDEEGYRPKLEQLAEEPASPAASPSSARSTGADKAALLHRAARARPPLLLGELRQRGARSAWRPAARPWSPPRSASPRRSRETGAGLVADGDPAALGRGPARPARRSPAAGSDGPARSPGRRGALRLAGGRPARWRTSTPGCWSAPAARVALGAAARAAAR